MITRAGNAMPAPASGIGYRTPHRAAIESLRPAVGFLEVHAENHMGGGRGWAEIERLRRHWPLSIHGVGLSLGSAERPDEQHLERLAGLVSRIDPVLVSEHLAFSTVGGDYLNALLPVPMTRFALRVVCRNVDIVQQRLGRPILVENPSRYLDYRGAELCEPEFLNELARRTGCGLLLDLTNVHVSCANLGGDPRAWCRALDTQRVGEIHLAGHGAMQADGETLLIDDHASPVSTPVWDLFDAMVPALPDVPVLVEWDGNLPAPEVLIAQAAEADARRERVLAAPAPRWAGRRADAR